MSVNKSHDLRLSSCRHFNGIQHKACGAGIVLRDMRDVSQPGIARWPCLTIPGREQLHSCSQFSAYTAEEMEVEDREIAALLSQFGARIARGECGQCGKPATFEIAGHCKYARPCGCRIGTIGADEP